MAGSPGTQYLSPGKSIKGDVDQCDIGSVACSLNISVARFSDLIIQLHNTRTKPPNTTIAILLSALKVGRFSDTRFRIAPTLAPYLSPAPTLNMKSQQHKNPEINTVFILVDVFWGIVKSRCWFPSARAWSRCNAASRILSSCVRPGSRFSVFCHTGSDF